MQLLITRDSVCAADDLDPPHERRVRIPSGASVAQLVQLAISNADLPTISGGEATWCASSGFPIAVVAQQWTSPRQIPFELPGLSEFDVSGDVVRFHFTYFAQKAPEEVLDTLKRLTLRSPR